MTGTVDWTAIGDLTTIALAIFVPIGAYAITGPEAGIMMAIALLATSHVLEAHR